LAWTEVCATKAFIVYKFVITAVSVAKIAPTPTANATHPQVVLRLTYFFLSVIIRNWQKAMLAYTIDLKLKINARDD
jgi:hypothetical protein